MDELVKEGIEIEFLPNIENGKLVLHITKGDVEKAKTLVKNHNAIFSEPTVLDKLASVGLSVSDLKAALGL